MKPHQLLLLLGVAACSSTPMPVVTGVQFKLQSPFCGANAYQLQLSIDSVVVARDTLRDGQLSTKFATAAGAHRLNARITGGTFTGFVFDTVATVPADSLFVQIIDVYCS